jgi:hypothetical protein
VVTGNGNNQALRHLLSVTLLVGIFAGDAAAQDVDRPPGTPDSQTEIALTGGVIASDNIARDTESREDGTISRVGTAITFERDTHRIRANVDGNIFYERYSDDLYDEDVIGGLTAALDIGIVPERFHWVTHENFGQIVSDPFVADTPDNRENVNFLTTGPDLLFHFGGDNALTLSARYSGAQYETNALDSTQLSAAIAFAHELSSATQLSFNVSGERIEFDSESLTDDYDRQQMFVRYAAHGARTALTLDLGYTQLDLGDEKPDGLLGRLQLRRQLSPSASLSMSVGTQFSDSSSLFRQGQDAQGASALGVRAETSDVIGVSDPFRSEFAQVGFDFARQRTSFGLSIQRQDEKYETQSQLDRRTTTYSAYFSRHLGYTVDAGLSARKQVEKIEALGFEDDDVQLGCFVNWALGRRVSLRLQYQHVDRDSSIFITNFVENQVGLFVSFFPLGRP